MSRNQSSITSSVAAMALSATNIFDLPLWAYVVLRTVGLVLVAVLLFAAWRWYRSRDLAAKPV